MRSPTTDREPTDQHQPTDQAADPAYWTTAMIAERYHVSPATVRKWRRASARHRTDVPRQGWVRIGRESLLPADQLHRFEENLRRSGTGRP